MGNFMKKSSVNNVILIIMDDVRGAHLFELLSQGKLPHIQKLSENGITCNNCITSFPSITYPSYSNIVLGAYSGYYKIDGSGVPMYHWVARDDPPSIGKKFPTIHNYGSGRYLRNINKDIGKTVQTIFEQGGEGNFLSSMNLIYRGSEFIPPKEFTSAFVFKRVEEAFKKPIDFFSNNEAPKITVAYVPKTDELMHDVGFSHPEYLAEIIRCDQYIGSLINTLKELGYYDSTAIGIISDHGNYKAEKMHDLEPFFNEHGLIQYNPKSGTGDFDAIIGSVGFLNFRGKTWFHHPDFDELSNFTTSSTPKNNLNVFEMLWNIPGVKLMYYRDDSNTPDKGIIYIKYREGGKLYNGTIEYQGHGKEQRTKYTFDDKDIYSYENNEISAILLDNKFHSIDEWLKGTNNIDFPIVVDQVPRYFKNPRSCDVMISTLGEYGFGYEHGKTMPNTPYSHDICLKKSMTVPFIIGGSSNIPSMEIPYCKTTDMVPTLLDLLGIKAHKSVVGITIFDY